MSDKEHWTKRAWQGLLLLIVIGIGARVVYGLLVPLFPVIGTGVLLCGIALIIFRRRGE